MTLALPPEGEWRTQDGVRCLECGQWKRALGRHLPAAHGMSAAEYRQAWGMRQRQPLSSEGLSQVRREIANATGGPQRMNEYRPVASPLAARARAGRERRAQERVSVQAGQRRAADRSRADADRRADDAARALGHADVGAYLRRRYVVDEQPRRVLIDELGVNRQVVDRLMDEHQVPRRGSGPLPGGHLHAAAPKSSVFPHPRLADLEEFLAREGRWPAGAAQDPFERSLSSWAWRARTGRSSSVSLEIRERVARLRASEKRRAARHAADRLRDLKGFVARTGRWPSKVADDLSERSLHWWQRDVRERRFETPAAVLAEVERLYAVRPRRRARPSGPADSALPKSEGK